MKKELLKTGLLIGIQEALEQEESKGNDMPLNDKARTEQEPNLAKFKSGNNEYFSEAMGPLRYSAAEHKRLETIAAHVTGKSEETKTNDQKAQDIIAKLTGRNKPATTTVPKSRL